MKGEDIRMRSNTQSVSLSERPAEVFAFLADPLNLPRWAVGFCRAIRVEREELTFSVFGEQLAIGPPFRANRNWCLR